MSELHVRQTGLIAPRVGGLGNASRHFWKGLSQWTTSPGLSGKAFMLASPFSDNGKVSRKDSCTTP